jgi:hypothetical protein
MKKAIIFMLIFGFGATLLYAGSGNLIVNNWLSVGSGNSPAYPLDVTGNANVAGNLAVTGTINGLTLPGPLSGAATGLSITNNSSSPTNKINLSASSIGTVVPSGTMTIDCTQHGLAGGNDLDAGSLAASTWYYIWVIYNGTTVAGLASLSSTSPALPSGFTYKRLVGVAATNSSSQFKVFSQIGNHFVYDEYQTVSTGTTTQSWTVQNCTAYIPPITTRGWFQIISHWDGTHSPSVSLRKNGSSSNNGHQFVRAQDAAGWLIVNDWVDTDSSQSTQLNVTAASSNWSLIVVGFELNL